MSICTIKGYQTIPMHQCILFINVIAESSEFCLTNVDRFNTKWDQTKVGTVIEMACTGNYTGTVSRLCDTGGQWKEPDNSQCTSVAIQNLQKQVNLTCLMFINS